MLPDNVAKLDRGALLSVTEFAGASQRKRSALEEKQEKRSSSAFSNITDMTEDGAVTRARSWPAARVL